MHINFIRDGAIKAIITHLASNVLLITLLFYCSFGRKANRLAVAVILPHHHHYQTDRPSWQWSESLEAGERGTG